MLKLQADPTFTADVKIPSPDGDVVISFTFNHMRKSEFAQFINGDDSGARSDEDTVLAIAKSWSGIEAEFNRESLTELFQNYHGAARAIVFTWAEQLTGSRL